MSTTVLKIMHLPIFVNNSELLAGQGGLENEVLQATVMEVPDFNVATVRSTTFILTTLFAHHENIDNINAVIERLCKRGVAGIAIKLGRFLNAIDSSTIAIAESYNIPLFAFNNQVLFRDLIGEILSEVVFDQRAVIKDVNALNAHLIDEILNNRGIPEILRELTARVESYCCCLSVTGELLAENSSLNERLDLAALHADIGAIFPLQGEMVTKYHVHDGYHIFPCSVHQKTAGSLIVRFASKPNERDILYVRQIVSFVSLKLLEQLLQVETEHRMISSILDDVLFGQHAEEEFVRDRLKLLGLVPQDTHLIMLVTGRDNGNATPHALFSERHFTHIKTQFQKSFINVNIHLKGYDAIIILSLRKSIKYMPINELANTVLISIEEAHPNLEQSIYLGYGMVIDNLCRLPECYMQARKAIEFGKRFSRNHRVFSYQEFIEMGLLSHGLVSSDYRLIYEQVINPIREYDAANDSKLWDTLGVSLFSQNLQEAAEQIFIHVSTLRYRLQKIEGLTNICYNEPRGRLLLQLAFILFTLSE